MVKKAKTTKEREGTKVKDKTIKQKKEKKISITQLVLNTFRKEPEITYEGMTEIVLKHNPASKWKGTHFAWYKYQIREGRYALPEAIVKKIK